MAKNDKPKKNKKPKPKPNAVPFSPLQQPSLNPGKLTKTQLKQTALHRNKPGNWISGRTDETPVTTTDVKRALAEGTFVRPQGPKPGAPAPGPSVGQSGEFNTPEPRKTPEVKATKKVSLMRSDDPKMVSLEVRKQALKLEINSGKKVELKDASEGDLRGIAELNKRARNRAGSAGKKQQQFTKSAPGQGTPSIIPNIDDNTAASLREAYDSRHSELKENVRNALGGEEYKTALKAYNAHRQKGKRFKAKVEYEESLKSVSKVRRTDSYGEGEDVSDWMTHEKLSTNQMSANLPAKPPVYAPGHKFAVVSPEGTVKSITKGVGARTPAPAAALEQGVTPLITNNLPGRKARLEAEFHPQNTSGEN